MNREERIEAVKSMNTMVLSLNDEDFLDRWYTFGVADCDTNYEDYISDSTLHSLLLLFTQIMHDATSDGIRGTFYVDGITS